ncbi:MAG TPA: M48 family metallopeptidase [Pyrinomonadaceae bacterium]|nr:M48 family metallopeptidase [Pyrinomonadaceae bacterium]
MLKRRRKSVAFVLAAVFVLGQLGCSNLFSGRGEGERGGKPAPHFKPGFNLFSPEQDIELGKRSAQQMAQEMPLLNDEAIVTYIRQLGANLASRASGHKFPYQFNVVATKELNAFALPGGFIFINAGAIAAAKNEGELAGVIAHEITHVALRHGTNQASKAYIAQKGLGVIGAITGDDSDIGQVINSVGGAGANMLFLRFGRTAEKQADLEGARIMAESGYDPRDMANFFKTLQTQGGQRTPEFLSDHPDPGNRVAAITNALPSLRVSDKPVRDTQAFNSVKARLEGRRAAGSLNSTAVPERTGPRDPTSNTPGTAARPAPPAPSFQPFRAGDNSFAFQYPANWDALSSGDDGDAQMIFAPKGAYGKQGEALVVTHGIFIGAVAPADSDLARANAAYVQQQLDINADFRVTRQPQRIVIGGREGYATMLAGPSVVTGVTEVDIIYTTATADGRLFYLITMAPEDEFESYQPAFQQIIESLQLAR